MCINKIIPFWIIFWQILLVSFAKSCLQAVHSASYVRGQREIEHPLELRSWTAQSLPRGMWSVPTLWWLLWIVSMTLSRLIIGDICTPVLVLYTLGWFDYSMPTLKWFRMMTAGWCFSLLLEGILSLLIPRSSVSSLEFLFSRCLRALAMRWYFLRLWMISESFSTQFHRGE
jgi:hypothetical protein